MDRGGFDEQLFDVAGRAWMFSQLTKRRVNLVPARHRRRFAAMPRRWWAAVNSNDNYAMDLIFVSSDIPEQRWGPGKISERFFDRASAWIERRSGSIYRYGLREYLENADRHTSGVLLPIYNELPVRPAGYEIEAAEAVSSRLLIVNGTWVARVIRDKALSNRIFFGAGIPVPEAYEGSASGTVFSNAIKGSGKKVWIVNQGQTLAPDRYNVRFIDTSQEFRGNRYYVSLRAMCFGVDCHAVYVRARPVSDGDPSVHARNTPVDPDLLAHLNETVALPRREQINRMCRQIGAVLGPGFYAHDILPENSGALFLSEVGFKYDDYTHREHFQPIRHRIPYYQELYGAETTSALDSLSRQYEALMKLRRKSTIAL